MRALVTVVVGAIAGLIAFVLFHNTIACAVAGALSGMLLSVLFPFKWREKLK